MTRRATASRITRGEIENDSGASSTGQRQRNLRRQLDPYNLSIYDERCVAVDLLAAAVSPVIKHDEAVRVISNAFNTVEQQILEAP